MNDRIPRDEYGNLLRASPDDGYSQNPGVVYGDKRRQMYGDQAIPPGMMQPQPQVTTEMTMEDMRLLRECNKESFWKRCEFHRVFIVY